MAELVDALVSGTSDESRGGSSPLQGTTWIFLAALPLRKSSVRRSSQSVAGLAGVGMHVSVF